MLAAEAAHLRLEDADEALDDVLVAYVKQGDRGDQLLMHVEEDVPPQVAGESGGDLADVEAAIDVEEKLVVPVQLAAQEVRQRVEAHKLVDAPLLRLVPAERGTHVCSGVHGGPSTRVPPQGACTREGVPHARTCAGRVWQRWSCPR